MRLGITYLHIEAEEERQKGALFDPLHKAADLKGKTFGRERKSELFLQHWRLCTVSTTEHERSVAPTVTLTF